MSAPLTFAWDGDVMVPVMSCRRAANEAFVVGERYRMQVVEERSQRSHNHYFATIADMYDSLPEDRADQFVDADHLRKYALIKSGYSNLREIVCSSEAQAKDMAAFIRPIDPYALVTANRCVVRVFTAKSQKRNAMDRREFQESKDKVLDYIAGLLGVDRADVPQSEAA